MHYHQCDLCYVIRMAIKNSSVRFHDPNNASESSLKLFYSNDLSTCHQDDIENIKQLFLDVYDIKCPLMLKEIWIKLNQFRFQKKNRVFVNNFCLNKYKHKLCSVLTCSDYSFELDLCKVHFEVVKILQLLFNKDIALTLRYFLFH